MYTLGAGSGAIESGRDDGLKTRTYKANTIVHLGGILHIGRLLMCFQRMRRRNAIDPYPLDICWLRVASRAISLFYYSS